MPVLVLVAPPLMSAALARDIAARAAARVRAADGQTDTDAGPLPVAYVCVLAVYTTVLVRCSCPSSRSEIMRFAIIGAGGVGGCESMIPLLETTAVLHRSRSHWHGMARHITS